MVDTFFWFAVMITMDWVTQHMERPRKNRLCSWFPLSSHLHFIVMHCEYGKAARTSIPRGNDWRVEYTLNAQRNPLEDKLETSTSWQSTKRLLYVYNAHFADQCRPLFTITQSSFPPPHSCISMSWARASVSSFVHVLCVLWCTLQNTHIHNIHLITSLLMLVGSVAVSYRKHIVHRRSSLTWSHVRRHERIYTPLGSHPHTYNYRRVCPFA